MLESVRSRPSTSVRTRSGLTDDLVRALVTTKTTPRRLTQDAVIRPLGELHFSDHVGAHEVRKLGLGRAERAQERRRLSCSRGQEVEEFFSGCRRETGAHLADVL